MSVPTDPNSTLSSLCPICLEELSEGSAASTRCGHRAHAACLRTCMRTGMYLCPLCRMPFGDVPVDADAGSKLARYSRMLRSGLAQAVVRQRMVVDGVPPAAIDAFFTGGASIAVQNEDDTVVPRAAQAVNLEKFDKMLRMGLDVGAVQQKMGAAGVTPAAIEAFFAVHFHRD